MPPWPRHHGARYRSPHAHHGSRRGDRRRAVLAGDDLGDVLSLALGQAADRLGGYEALVAGRPGSWEADLVRRLAHQYAADGLLAGRQLY